MAGANNVTVYLKCDRSVEVQSPDVYLKDLCSIRCMDNTVAAKMKALKVYHFQKDEAKRCVIDSLKLVELMEQECPNITVQLVGEPDVLVEWISVNKHKGWQQWLRAALVCLVSFFGTAFTIMAYHNDVGINEVFTEVYRMVMNREPGGLNVLEVAYSIGLAVGIIVFYGHFGSWKFGKDPTPLEVEMRLYEDDVDTAMIKQSEREKNEIDVD